VRVTLDVLQFSSEPRMEMQREQIVAMLLRPGYVELGWRRSGITKFGYDAGEMILCQRHADYWIRTDEAHRLTLRISDAALRAVGNDMSNEVELPGTPKLVDARVGALVAAVNAERAEGFPSGRLFLDSVEQALAAALVKGYAVRRPSVRTYRGGLTPARLRRVVELVHAKMESELTLDDLAESTGLSTAHFSQMFRKSTGESPHQFVLRHRVERGKEMLRTPDARVLDVAIACGFKTQQHFARMFRRLCGASPTEYRQTFQG
jgi:AraC family transcriptional regulator